MVTSCSLEACVELVRLLEMVLYKVVFVWVLVLFACILAGQVESPFLLTFLSITPSVS
jgi:hypothetical protein